MEMDRQVCFVHRNIFVCKNIEKSTQSYILYKIYVCKISSDIFKLWFPKKTGEKMWLEIVTMDLHL